MALKNLYKLFESGNLTFYTDKEADTIEVKLDDDTLIIADCDSTQFNIIKS